MDFSATNTALWNGMIQLGILSAILLAANVLRRKVGFIRKSLMPTSVLAGFMALILRALGIIKLDALFLDSVTYHTIAIGIYSPVSPYSEEKSESYETSPDRGKKRSSDCQHLPDAGYTRHYHFCRLGPYRNAWSV